MEQLDVEVAYWFLDCFPEIHYKPNPTMPTEYSEFSTMTFEQKAKIGKDFWSHPKIKAYLDEKERIKNENKDNLMKLREFMGKIPKEDLPSIEKFKDRILEFEERMSGSFSAVIRQPDYSSRKTGDRYEDRY